MRPGFRWCAAARPRLLSLKITPENGATLHIFKHDLFRAPNDHRIDLQISDHRPLITLYLLLFRPNRNMDRFQNYAFPGGGEIASPNTGHIKAVGG